MSNDECLINENDDELLILVMQDTVYKLKDEWEKAQDEMLNQEDEYNKSKRQEKYYFEKLLAVAKFLNKYNSDAYEDWIDELGLRDLIQKDKQKVYTL
jgi:hypothetical protein